MKNPLILACVLMPGSLVAQSAVTLHYWDMDALDSDTSTIPLDLVGGAEGTAGGNLVLEDSAYGSSPAGGNYLATDREATGIPLEVKLLDNDTILGMDFGSESFSFSYWVYNDTTDDAGGDVRRVRVFDCLNATDVGIQLASNLEGTFNFRVDDDKGTEVISNNQAPPFGTLEHADDKWVHVAATINRESNSVEIFFDGVSQGTYEPFLMGNVVPGQDLQIGCINGGANGSGIQKGAIDDLAFYTGVLTSRQINDLVAGSLPTEVAPPGEQGVGHYWEFDTLNGFVPVDVFGGLTTQEDGIVSIGEDAAYGIPYAGAGSGLLTQGGFSDHLVADSYGDAGPQALDFGMDDFAISFWSYSPASDTYGAAVFDFMADDGAGVELGTNEFGIFELRVSDDAGNSVATNEFVAIDQVIQPEDQWVHVVINVDRAQNQLGVFFDGEAVVGSPFDMSTLTGGIACSQDLELGVRNGGSGAGNSQSAGLDDFAIYPQALSTEQISALANNSTDPLAILQSFVKVPTPELAIVSFDRDATTGEVSVVFGSAAGQSYSAFGGTDLENSGSWPLLGDGGIPGTGDDITFNYIPEGDPEKFFIQIRRD